MKFNSIKFSKLSTFLYSIGLVIVFLEFALKFYGKSICQTEGCRVVESFVKGGDIVLLLIGMGLFATLLLLSFVKRFYFLHSLILISAMAVEGYLLAFQAFVIKEFCIFCLVVFTILLLSSLLRFLMGHRELVFAFVCFASLFLITYLVNPRISDFPSAKQNYVLVYSKDCPHCKEVIQFCEQMSIPIHKIEVDKVSGLMRALNLKSVPILYCNEGLEKKFILGAENIKGYLLTKNAFKQKEEGFCPLFEASECK